MIKELKEINPKIKFSIDFIIGYPDEKKDDFDATLRLIEKVQFINCYSFIYSPRHGTPAAKMRQIRDDISKERLIKFQKIADKIKSNYKKSLLNKKSSVLFENKTKNKNEYFGRDEFSNSIIVKSEENLRGKIKEVKIIDGNQNTLFGEIEQQINDKLFVA